MPQFITFLASCHANTKFFLGQSYFIYILGRIQKYPEEKRTVPTLAMKLEEKHKPAS